MADEIADISRFEFRELERVQSDIREKYGFDGDLARQYAENKGALVHKWHHYIPLYDRYFSKFRGKPVRFLEIGVAKGGSLSLWRKFLGPDAILFGIDIDPACDAFDGDQGQVRIGSQSDPSFLDSVVNEMGGVDVVLDDGSHRMEDVRKSLQCLFPQLSQGGLYFIEDLHTAYWGAFGGGYNHPDNFFNLVREIIDDMHHWYHSLPVKHGDVASQCPGIHIHDSIVVLEKAAVQPPVHSQVS